MSNGFYIEEHRTEIEAEYQEILQTREDIYQYWEERNHDRFINNTKTSRSPEKEALWAKLEAQKARRRAA